MSILETALVFLGIPLLVFGAVAGLVYAGGAHRSRRYRPGRPYEFAPVWFLAAAPESAAATVTEGGVLELSSHRAALPAGRSVSHVRDPGPAATDGPVAPRFGGARGTW